MPDLPFGGFPAADPLTSADLFAVSQAGVSKKATQQLVLNSILGRLTLRDLVASVAVNGPVFATTLFSPVTIPTDANLYDLLGFDCDLDQAADMLVRVYGSFVFASAASAVQSGIITYLYVDGVGQGSLEDEPFFSVGPANLDTETTWRLSWEWLVSLDAGHHVFRWRGRNGLTSNPVTIIQGKIAANVEPTVLTETARAYGPAVFADVTAGGILAGGQAAEVHGYHDLAVGGILAGGIGSEFVNGPHFDAAVGGVLAGGILVDTYAPVHDYTDAAVGGVLAGGLVADDYAPVTHYTDFAIGGVLAGGDCSP